MKDPNEYLDSLSRDALSGWEVPPPAHVAEGIHKRMFWFNLWRSAAWKYSLVALCALLVVASGWIGIKALQQDDQPSAIFADAKQYERKELHANASDLPVENGQAKETSGNTALQANNSSAGLTSALNVDQPVSVKAQPPQQPVASQISARVPANVQASENNSFPSGVSVTNDPPDFSVTSDEKSSQTTGIVPNEKNREVLLSSESFMTVEEAGAGQQAFVRVQEPQRIPLIYPAVLSVISMQKLPAPKFHVRPRFDLSLAVSPLFGNTGEKQTDLIRVKTKEPSGSVSLLLQYNLKSWFLETGLQATTLKTLQQTEIFLYNPREFQQQLLIGQETQVDTSSYWHYFYIQDSVIRVRDSVWTTDYDSTFNNIYHDSVSTIYDTLRGASWKSSITLFEIPFGIGYRFYAGSMEFNLKGGIMLGISSQLNGQTLYENSTSGLVSFSEYYTTKQLQYSFYLSASAILPLDENWALMLSPSYRSSINGFKSNEGLPTRNYSAWGVGLGLRYEF